MNEAIGRARRLRADLPLFGAEQRLKEIEETLCGKSIHLPPVDIPFEQRTLLSGLGGEEGNSPDELLGLMAQAFEAAKGAVVAVDRAWRSLGGEMSAACGRIHELRDRAAAAGCSVTAELDAAEHALDETRAKAQSDPLGSSGALGSTVRPAIDRAEAAVTARERLLREVADGLAGARRQMELLTGLHREAVAACADARVKIANCKGLAEAADDSKIAGLGAWLERLEQKNGEGLVEPLLVGIGNWNSSASECVSLEREALKANRGPVEARNELRGRLDALTAKARARGVGEEEALVELARRAEDLLYTRPTAMDQAAAAVSAYEKRLNGRGPRAGATGGGEPR